MKKNINRLALLIAILLTSLFVAACERQQFTVSFDSQGGSEVAPILVLYDEPIEKPENPTKEGYSFDGWYLEENLATAYDFKFLVREDFTLYAKWKINSYVFKFETNGGTLLDEKDEEISTITVEYLGSVTAPLSDPEKDGYEFEGWYADSQFTKPFDFEDFKMPAKDTTIYAKWSASTCKVRFEVDNLPFEELDIELGKPVGNFDLVPTKEGYTFLGWYVTDKDGKEKEFTSSYVINESIVVTAKWSINQYTISFEENGGSDVTDITLDYYSDITRPTNPTKEGHTFAGWYLDSEFKEEYSFENAKMPSKNMTLYAKWNVNEYTISFEENGGSNVENITLPYQSSVTAPTAPTKEGYTFGGWYSDAELTNAYTFDKMPLDGTTLYAKWTINQYTIAFEENGGSEVENIVKDYLAPVTRPENPTREGHNFVNWYSDENLTQVYEFTTMPLEGITLYAKWQANEYRITFVSNGGSAVSEIVEDYLVEIAKPADPTKIGYTFGGWYTNEGLTGEEFEFDTMPLKGATLYAKWTINQYTISFVENEGSEVADIKQDYASAVAKPTDPKLAGYTFSGWYSDEELTEAYIFTTMPAHDVTLYAKWTVKQYTINFEENGGSEVLNITADYLSSVHKPTNPTKEGYSFGGWFEKEDLSGSAYEFDTMPLEGITLYAKWNIESYTLTIRFNNGSADLVIENVEFNKSLLEYKPEDPTKPGTQFIGWISNGEFKFENETMPSHNLVVTAMYADEISVSFEGSDTLIGIAGEDLVVPADPKKEGHTFDGWYLDKECTVVFNLTVFPEVNTPVYAKWNINQYTISFEENGGNSVTDITQDFASTVTKPADPSKEGHNFAGWYSDEKLTQEYSFLTMPSKDITLYAKWNINQYTISFEENGGTTVADKTQDYATTVTKPQDPTKEGHTFSGWYSNEGLTEAYEFTTMPAENITLYAKWTINKYTITFEENGGSEVVDIKQDYASAVAKPTNPTLEGYTFVGWYRDEALKQAYSFENAKIEAENITLYAKWTANNYQIIFETSDPFVKVNPIEAPYKSTIDSLPRPTRNGYQFGGWFAKSDLSGNEVVSVTMPLDGITLYAYWIPNEYTIVFDLNGGSGSVTNINAKYGETYPFPKTGFSREGYTLIGWSYNKTGLDVDFDLEKEHGNLATSGTVTLYAVWKINQYTVTFVIDGKESKLTFDYGTEFKTVDNLPSGAKVGHTLTWKIDGNTVSLSDIIVKSNITITADYTKNPYNVHFVADGKIIYTIPDAVYGSVITFDDYVVKIKADYQLLKEFDQYILGKIVGQVTADMLKGYINVNKTKLEAVDSIIASAIDSYLKGSLNDEGLHSIVDLQASALESIIPGYDNNKQASGYVPFKKDHVFNAWLLGENAIYVDEDGNRHEAGSKFLGNVPASTNASKEVYIVAEFKKLAAIDEIEVGYNKETGSTTITWDAIDTSFIDTTIHEYTIKYDVYYRNGTKDVLLSSVDTNSYTFDEYGTYKISVYGTIEIYRKKTDELPKTLIKTLVTDVVLEPVEVSVEISGIGGSFDETQSGDYYRKGTDDEGNEIFIFYTNNEYEFAAAGFEFTITDKNGNVLEESEIASGSGNKLTINSKSGAFYFTNGINKDDEGNLIVYSGYVVPFVQQFTLDANLSNYKDNKTKNSNFLNPSAAIYTIGRYNATDVAEENDPNGVNANIYNNVLSYKNNGFHFGLSIKTLGGNDIEYIPYGDYITYKFYRLHTDGTINYNDEIRDTEMGIYDPKTDSWSFTAAPGTYGVVISIADSYLAPKQNPEKVEDKLFPPIEFIFKLDNSINVYTHEQFKTVYANFTLGSTNVGADGYIVRGISLHKDITAQISKNQTYYDGNPNPGNNYYNNTDGKGKDGSPLNIHMPNIYSYLGKEGFESGDVYLRATKETIKERYNINGNFFTIHGQKLPYASINSIGNLSGIGGYKIANTQLSILTYLVGQDTSTAENVKASVAHLFVNDLQIIGNTAKPSFDSAGSDSSLDVMNRNSGGYLGISANGSSLTVNNSIVSNATIGIRNNNGTNEFGELTGIWGLDENNKPKLITPSVTTISYTKVISCWANCVYGFFAGNFDISNSELKDSSGAAIHLEDGTSKVNDPTDAYLKIDKNTVIENFVAGTEGYFKANSMELIAMKVKASLDGNLNDSLIKTLNTNFGSSVPAYTINRTIYDQTTGLPTQKFNFAFLLVTAGDNKDATETEYAQANRMKLYLDYNNYAHDNTLLNQLGYTAQFNNNGYYDTIYMTSAYDATQIPGVGQYLPYALSGLTYNPSYNGKDGSEAMFIFENHDTGCSWLVGVGADKVVQNEE